MSYDRSSPGSGQADPSGPLERFTRRTLFSANAAEVFLMEDSEAAYRAVFAIDTERTQPAVGGSRLRSYSSVAQAAAEARALARSMTIKNVLADLPFGGAKAVIMEPGKGYARHHLMRTHGDAVEALGGAFFTGQDIGVGPDDLEVLRTRTRYVAGAGSVSLGDSGYYTGYGVFQAIKAAVHHRWGLSTLSGMTVGIQGCGAVGSSLARWLHSHDARLVLCDPYEGRSTTLAEEVGGQVVTSDGIYAHPVDIFSPCAVGGVLSAATVPQLKAAVVAGGANNQLENGGAAAALLRRDILYAPDFVANAGGVIAGATVELLGLPLDTAMQRIQGIYPRLRVIFEAARHDNISPDQEAKRLAARLLEEEAISAAGQPGAGA